MGWDETQDDHAAVCEQIRLMAERNQIEKAKLAEMRAARAAIWFQNGDSSPKIQAVNRTADRLTAGVLGEAE